MSGVLVGGLVAAIALAALLGGLLAWMVTRSLSLSRRAADLAVEVEGRKFEAADLAKRVSALTDERDRLREALRQADDQVDEEMQALRDDPAPTRGSVSVAADRVRRQLAALRDLAARAAGADLDTASGGPAGSSDTDDRP